MATIYRYRSCNLLQVYSALKEMTDSHIHVYKKDELPDRWHYKNHRLVAPITVTADVGWFILTVS